MIYAYTMEEEEHDALAEARSADSVPGLHRTLLTRAPSVDGHHDEAVGLFSRFHGADGVGAVDSALLLCACWRWRRSTAKLIAAIVDAGVDDEGLDALADRMLWPERPTYDHPLEWLGLSWVEVDLGTGLVATSGTEQIRTVSSRLSPTPAPTRRWAAGRLLMRGKARLAAVLHRGGKLAAYSTESVLAGALDVYQHLHPDDAAHTLQRGLTSGRGLVPRQALLLLAARDGWAATLRLARQDADAGVRRWAEQQDEAEPTPTLF